MFQKTGSLDSLMAVFGTCGNVHGVASRVGGACGAAVVSCGGSCVQQLWVHKSPSQLSLSSFFLTFGGPGCVY